MTTQADHDSQMLSSPSDSDADNTQTPIAQASSVLSPPDSQQRATRSSNMPTAASSSAVANANGKRPLNTISNGVEDGENGARPMDQPRREFPTKTHAASGYKWDRSEDEPGFAWLSKKARDEFERAMGGMAHRESMVLGMQDTRSKKVRTTLTDTQGDTAILLRWRTTSGRSRRACRSREASAGAWLG